jgi:quinol monooxygenase YgiN
MIVLVARYYVQSGKGDQVAEALKHITPIVRREEEGCKLYLANRSEENPDLFLLYEHYRDEEALRAHRETPHFKKIIEGIVYPLLERRERELFTLVEDGEVAT